MILSFTYFIYYPIVKFGGGGGEILLAAIKLRGSEEDAQSDMDRRQTEVVHAIVKEIYSLSDTTKMDDIINLLSDDMSTNVDQKSLMKFIPTIPILETVWI